jgi:putative tricarboxylic transport membrane protein
MRRDAFLKTLAALAAAGALPAARAATNMKMMIPANPGGGWDSTGRALGKALQEAGAASAMTYENKGGAAGAIGLAQFVNAAKGDPNALIMMGQVMIGGIITGKPPVSITQCTPIARLTSEYSAFVLPAQSPLKTMKDVIEQMKKDPGSVKWGGGSRGSTEHVTIAMIAREVGVDATKINYVPFRGGGEAVAAILGNNVTVGASGYSEFQQYIESGKMRAIAMASPARQKGIAVPTLKELGINVELGNWRGVYGAPGINAEQRKALTDAVVKATKTKSWTEALAKNNWTACADERQGVRRLRRPRVRDAARDDGQGRDDLSRVVMGPARLHQTLDRAMAALRRCADAAAARRCGADGGRLVHSGAGRVCRRRAELPALGRRVPCSAPAACG